jgi:hypothetical protein
MDERIQRIADLAGVDYEIAYDWIIDPNGDWQNAAEPCSRDEHETYINHSSDEEIASWIRAGQ